MHSSSSRVLPSSELQGLIAGGTDIQLRRAPHTRACGSWAYEQVRSCRPTLSILQPCPVLGFQLGLVPELRVPGHIWLSELLTPDVNSPTLTCYGHRRPGTKVRGPQACVGTVAGPAVTHRPTLVHRARQTSRCPHQSFGGCYVSSDWILRRTQPHFELSAVLSEPLVSATYASRPYQHFRTVLADGFLCYALRPSMEPKW